MEYRRQMPLHPFRTLRARDPGDTDHAIVAELRQLLWGWGSQKQHGRQAREGGDFHGRGGSSEVVSIETEERPIGKRAPRAHAAASRALAREGLVRAYSPSGTPATAASHASRSAVTPAATPSGCAMMPPPAATIRSVDPSAAYVPGACLTVWPDEKTGIAVQGLRSNIGVRH